MKKAYFFLALVMAGVFILANTNKSATVPDGFVNGTPDLKSISALVFGPNGILFIGDSKSATVFAIDPFAGRLAVYDPSLSIQVTQDLPTFGLPVRAQAVIDARNLLDIQPATNNGATLLQIGPNGRTLRGGILVRF